MDRKKKEAKMLFFSFFCFRERERERTGRWINKGVEQRSVQNSKMRMGLVWSGKTKGEE